MMEWSGERIREKTSQEVQFNPHNLQTSTNNDGFRAIKGYKSTTVFNP